MSGIRILVVDDFQSWQRFVLQKLESETVLQVISVAADGLEAIEKAKELQPDLILMDLSMPGISGIGATRQIRVLSPGSKILVLSEHRGSDFIQAAFDAGACGYILKSDSDLDLLSGIRAVCLGQQFVSRSLANWRENPDGIE
jgi:DNA-binding NarL/FixJ family response regulator